MDVWLSAAIFCALLSCGQSYKVKNCNDQNSCFNGGVCSEGGLCRCPQEWTGLRCEMKNPCLEQDFCNHNETCQPNADGSVKCLSKLATMPCAESNPCENGGVCMTNGSSFVCRCKAGWMGERCEQLDSFCGRGNVCQNGGTCLDMRNKFQCFCSTGWFGQFCEQKINCPPEFSCPAKSQNNQCDPECHSLECGLDGGECLVSSDGGWTIPGFLLMVIRIRQNEDFSDFTVRSGYLIKLSSLLNATVQISNFEKLQEKRVVAISLMITQYDCRSRSCFKSIDQVVHFINSAVRNHLYRPEFQILKLIAKTSPNKSEPTVSGETYSLIFGLLMMIVGLVFILVGIHTHRKRIRVNKTWLPPVGQTVGERLLPSPDHTSKANFSHYHDRDSIRLEELSSSKAELTLIESAILDSLTSTKGVAPLPSTELDSLKSHISPEGVPTECNADLNKPINDLGETLLHLCARYNCGQAATNLLLQAGAKLDVRDKSGRTPIATASASDALETLPALLDHRHSQEEGKLLSKRRRVLMHDVARSQKSESFCYETVSPLIESIKAFCEESALMIMEKRVVSILITDQYGWTALHWAVVQRFESLVERILYNRECTRAFVNQPDHEQGRTPLHLAVRLVSSNPECIGIVRLLVEVGNARSDIKDIHDRTARDLAKEMEAHDVARLLDQYCIQQSSLNRSDPCNDYLTTRTVSSIHTLSDHSQCSSHITSPVHSQHSESSHVQSFEYMETQI